MQPHRRHFLSTGLGTLAAASLTPSLPGSTTRKYSPNDTISCALIGCGGRGRYLLGLATKVPGVTFTAVADVQGQQRARAVDQVNEAQGKRCRAENDFRRVLDDNSLGVVIIATPHHWHTPIAVRALESGKHIYIEKPASHVFREGRLLVDAAAQSRKVVQHGTQMRSSPVTAEAAKVLKSGLLGEIVMSKAFGVEPRGNAPDAVPDSSPPDDLDYPFWLGPAPERPFNAHRFNRWNSFRDYGNGEIGGDGIHDIDMARWGLGVASHPIRIVAHGSRVKLKGEGDFPDNMIVTYEYEGGKVLVYENRNFAPYGERGFDNANIFYGTEGYMLFTRRGAFQTFLGPKEEPGPSLKTDNQGNEENIQNFFDSIRTGSPSNADAETAHLSCALVHLGEIAYRTQRAIRFDPSTESITGDTEASSLLTKPYRAPWSFSPA